MGFPALEEVDGKIDVLRKKMSTVFEEAGPDNDFARVKSVKGNTFDIASQVRQWNDELSDLSKKRADLAEVEKAAERIRQAPDDGAGEDGDGSGEEARRGEKTFGQLFTASKAWKDRNAARPTATLPIGLKTLLTTTAGWAPEVTRNGRVVDFATRPIQVADIIPTTTTGQNSVKYMEETTFTNSAAETAEGGTYPESALALTEKSSPVQKITTFIPVTDEQLEDVPQIEGYLNNRLPFMIRQRLDLQILVGNGTPPNLRGALNVSGIQTQAKGADTTPDAVYKAMVKVMTTGQANPDTVVFNPTNWQDIRLLRTADGIYIWGNPSDAGPERIWGLQVTLAQAMTAGTALVADLANFAELSVRRGINVQISNSHSTFFVEGKQAVRCDMRAALIWYRPAAICTITGL